MNLYCATDESLFSRYVTPADAAASLVGLTVVLRHAGGPLGFDRPDGVPVLQALLGDVTVVEWANLPHWQRLPRADVSSPGLSVFGIPALCLCGPAPGLLGELARVQEKRLDIGKNELFRRHGRAPVPLASTIFDGWLTPDQRLEARALISLLGQVDRLSLWTFSDKGLQGTFFGRSVEELKRYVERVADAQDLPLSACASEVELPCW